MGKYTKVGQFTLEQSVMRASDPCYDKTVWCCGTVPDCLTGTWDAAVVYVNYDGWGTRVSLLIAKHASLPSFSICDDVRVDDEYVHFGRKWTRCEFEVGVDSAQAGLFDDSKYQDQKQLNEMPAPKAHFGDDRWYNQCRDLTMSDMQAGVLPFGVVSSSGVGDGGYIALKHQNGNGKVDCVLIVF